MASEVMYAELNFENESKSSGTNSEPLSAPNKKTSSHKSNPSFPKLFLASLLILVLLLAISFFIAFIKETWSCCPKNWSSHNSNCYFISTTSATWDKSEKICSEEGAHLLVINTKEEQDFIIQKLNKNSAYYVGLSHPEGKDQWQWVDQTPYNESVVFWHQGEPSNLAERCVLLLFRFTSRKWGWNDVFCNDPQHLICKMKKIYL
ncbi:C-type lectin domain family 4 member A isoform X3 [Choloepus didactylus]|uniref:C-type lectin domain family 4 member A isoform X3 n=1 Tax=Choloepus didactylus TaxID=27675 RepID=UPI00189CC7FD|nr:C-type lectin domain family 4 member A isoform X3 [Choloepus didactylus]